jgi:hypothetical protein
MWFNEDHILQAENYLSPLGMAMGAATAPQDYCDLFSDLTGVVMGLQTSR